MARTLSNQEPQDYAPRKRTTGQTPQSMKINTSDGSASRANFSAPNNRGPKLDGPSKEPVTRTSRVARPGRNGGPEMLGTRGNKPFTPKTNNAMRTRGQ